VVDSYWSTKLIFEFIFIGKILDHPFPPFSKGGIVNLLSIGGIGLNSPLERGFGVVFPK
jgi:hypothetical protein